MEEDYGTIIIYALNDPQSLLKQLSPDDNPDTDTLGLLWDIVPTNSGHGTIIEGDGPTDPAALKAFAAALHERTQLPIKLVIDPDGNETYRETFYWGTRIHEKRALDGLYRVQYVLIETIQGLTDPSPALDNLQHLLKIASQEIDRLERSVHGVWDIYPGWHTRPPG